MYAQAYAGTGAAEYRDKVDQVVAGLAHRQRYLTTAIQRPAPQEVDADPRPAGPAIARRRGTHRRPRVRLEPVPRGVLLDWSSDSAAPGSPATPALPTSTAPPSSANSSPTTTRSGSPAACRTRRCSASRRCSGCPAAVQRLSSGRVTYRPAAALTHLASILSPGDVVLIEQQMSGPNGGTRYVPAEWVQSVFDATALLTRRGVIVVATGGNGNPQGGEASRRIGPLPDLRAALASVG